MAYEQIITVSGTATSGQVPQADGNGGYGWATPAAGVSPSSTTPAMDGTGAAGSSTDYARGDHVHPTDTSRAASSHSHGNVTNAGAITATGVALANNDTLVFVDSSDSSKLKQTSIKFDGSTATKALTQKGTFETFLTSHQDISGLAPLASPALTGTPTAPTASAGTNTTQIATTAFVKAAVDAKSVPSASSTTPKMDGTAAVGTETAYARGDHVHPTDTSRAALASPTFTGTPKAPTATAGTNTTQLATTAFVTTAVGNAAGSTVTVSIAVSDWSNGSATKSVTGMTATKNIIVTPDPSSFAAAVQAGVYCSAQGSGTLTFAYSNVIPTASITMNVFISEYTANTTSYAPLSSPSFTGTPTAPTAASGTNTTQLATTAFVTSAIQAQTDKMGVANGYATLDADAKVYAYQISKTMVEVTGNRTLAVSDDGKWLNVTASSAVTITIPTYASVAIPIGAEITVCRWGTGAVTFSAASGVTVQSAQALTALEKNTVAHFKKIAANYWLLSYEYQDAPSLIKVDMGTISALPATASSSLITSEMELIRAEIGNTNVQDGDWTVTTANGSVTVSGSILDSTTLVLYLSSVITAS